MSHRTNKATGNLTRRATSTSATPPPPAALSNTARLRLISPENAKKELIDRKLLSASNTITVNNLINILIGFTGKEETNDGLGEPWEIVAAVGHLLDAEVVSLVSKATADATVSRLESLREMVRKERDEDNARLDKWEAELTRKEARAKEESGLLVEERGRVAEERKKLVEESAAWREEKEKMEKDGKRMEESVEKMKELVTKLEKETAARAKEQVSVGGGDASGAGGRRWSWEDGQGVAEQGMVGEGSRGDFGGGFGGGYGGGFNKRPAAYGGFAGTRGSYAEATAMGGHGNGQGAESQERESGLTDQQIKDGEEQIKKDEERRARQLMLDSETVNGQKGLLGLTPQQLIEKAFAALNEMTGEGIMRGRPEKIEFVSAAVQRQGGVLYELSTREERDWLVRPDVCEKFTDNFGCSVRYRARKFPVLVEFVPVEVNINMKETLETIETTNGLEKGSIIGAKWIRDPSRRGADQRHAHLIINCKSKEVANGWIQQSQTIGGSSVSSTKLLPKPMRCYKCQLDGHLAKQCILEEVCGTCGQGHRTDACDNRKNLYCVACKEKGHPTWSSACPNYVTRCTNLSDRLPDNRYKYYVTSEQWTWERLSNDTNRRRFRTPRLRKDTPPTRPTAGTGANATPLPANPAHPRPDNLARPAPGGAIIPPRQGQLTTWLNPASAQDTQTTNPTPTNTPTPPTPASETTETTADTPQVAPTPPINA